MLIGEVIEISFRDFVDIFVDNFESFREGVCCFAVMKDLPSYTKYTGTMACYPEKTT